LDVVVVVVVPLFSPRMLLTVMRNPRDVGRARRAMAARGHACPRAARMDTYPHLVLSLASRVSVRVAL
jgi:hypothetical protein